MVNLRDQPQKYENVSFKIKYILSLHGIQSSAWKIMMVMMEIPPKSSKFKCKTVSCKQSSLVDHVVQVMQKNYFIKMFKTIGI